MSKAVEHLKIMKKVKIGFIGAGQFGQSYLIPNMNIPGVELVGVSSLSGVDAHTVARQFNFGIATTDAGELIRQPDINLIFIATQHDSHGKYVLDSIRSGKSVYVEKPLAVNRDELYLISDAVEKHSGRVMVGYNRRFSQSFRLIKEFLTPRTEQMIINYRVNAGKLPRNHWVYRQEQGSGRIVGEVCHFIDCMVFLTGSLPVKIYSEVISSDNTEVFNNDNVLITIKFRDGSTGAIEYLANGNSLLPKERCEVFCEGKTAVMDNFTIIELYSGKNIKVHKLDGKKGHREEVIATINSISNGTGMPIPFRELEAISTATFAALESITTGNAVLL